MKRTQLYIEEELWAQLECRARRDKTSVSEAVRRILRESLNSDIEERKRVLLSAAGLWKDRKDLPDTDQYIRSLRKSDRREKMLERHWS